VKRLSIYCIVLISILHFKSVVAQPTFKYITIAERNKIYCTESLLQDSVRCEKIAASVEHMVYIPGVSPESTDEEKEQQVISLDKDIFNLKNFANCEQIKTLIFCVSESLFVRSSDKLEYETNTYYRKAHKINADRFLKRYETLFKVWFTNQTILISCWEW